MGMRRSSFKTRRLSVQGYCASSGLHGVVKRRYSADPVGDLFHLKRSARCRLMGLGVISPRRKKSGAIGARATSRCSTARRLRPKLRRAGRGADNRRASARTRSCAPRGHLVPRPPAAPYSLRRSRARSRHSPRPRPNDPYSARQCDALWTILALEKSFQT